MLYKQYWKYTLEIMLLNGCKVKNFFKRLDMLKILTNRGQRIVRYHDRILSSKKKSYNST